MAEARAAGVAAGIAAGIAYEEAGRGEPLLLLHGVGLKRAAWRPQIEAFAGRHRVIAWDMPGHGASERLQPDAGLEDFVDALERFVKALALPRFNLAGHSMGALLALGLALRRPERVLRLIALNAVYDRSDGARAEVLTRAREIDETAAPPRVEGPLRRWFGEAPGPAEAAAARQVRRWLESVDAEGYATAYRVFAGSDRAYVGRLGELLMPALFLTGTGDPNSTPQMSQRMAREAPKGCYACLRGQRHMMSLTAPEAVNDLLAAFLRQPTVSTSEVRAEAEA